MDNINENIMEMTSIVLDLMRDGNLDGYDNGWLLLKGDVPKWAAEFEEENKNNSYFYVEDYLEEIKDYTIKKLRQNGYLTPSFKMEMNVGYLKSLLNDCPDDLPVFVACNGNSNFLFNSNKPRSGTDTFVICDGEKVIITDELNYGNNEEY